MFISHNKLHTLIICYYLFKPMSEEIESHVLARFKLIKKIGSGAYGHVFKVVDRKTKKTKALKKNFDAFNNSTDAQRTYRQIMFLMDLKHPNIVILEEVIKAQNGKDIYLVFEHMDVDLYTLIRENILADKHKKYILYQTTKAMYYLHSAGLIHRDVKPSNILVNQACDAKLCDFGLVRSIDDDHDANMDVLTQYIATRWYRAPQILLGSQKYTKAIDIWSLGCLAAQMMKGKPLFPGTSTLNQVEKVLMWTGTPSMDDIQSLGTNFGKQVFQILSKTKKVNHKEYFHQIDPLCLDLIQKTLQFNPSKRPNIQEIITHPYLRQFYDASEVVKSCKKIKVQIDDNKRLTLRDYRSLIYDQIRKKDKTSRIINPKLLGVGGIQDSTLYRIREKPKKSIRTEESQQKQTLLFYEKPKKTKAGHQNDSRTVSIKRSSDSRKKSFYKGEALYQKHLKTIQQDWEKDHHQVDTKKMTIFKQHNRTTKQSWNKGKRSVTESDGRKGSKILGSLDTHGIHKK